MTEKLDPQQVVTFEELLRSMMHEREATRRVLVREGLLTKRRSWRRLRSCGGSWKGNGGDRLPHGIHS